jgi:hypothetical protein
VNGVKRALPIRHSFSILSVLPQSIGFVCRIVFNEKALEAASAVIDAVDDNAAGLVIYFEQDRCLTPETNRSQSRPEVVATCSPLGRG